MRHSINRKIVFSFLLILAGMDTSVVLGANYYMRADGLAKNKNVATSCSIPSTAMSIDTHNKEKFLPDDVIQLCDEGGEYKTSIIAPSSGADGHPIVYKNADGGTPTIDLSMNVGSSGWAAMGGGIYRKKGFGRVFWEDDIPLKAASAESLEDGNWYYPNGTHQLYYRPTNGTPAGHSIRTMWFNNDWSPYALDLRSRSNITVRGITINRTGGGIAHGQNKKSPVSPITNIVLHDNIISRCMWGIWSEVFENGVESDVNIHNNNISYCSSGISAWTGSDKTSGHTQHHKRYTITGNKILNLNSISDTQTWSDALLKGYYYTDHEGISFQDVQDSVISDNTITTTFVKDMTSDQYWCRAIYLFVTNGDAATTGNSILRNHITGHFYPSIYISSNGTIKGFENNLIAYNSIHYPLSDKGQLSFAISLIKAPNTLTGKNYFVNNTIVNDKEGTGIYVRFDMVGNWVIMNNIIKSPLLVSLSDANLSGNLDFSNNIYSTNASWGFLHGNAGIKFGRWKKHGNDINGSAKVDPLFVSKDNFHLQPDSPAINKGQPLDIELDRDIDGSPIFGNPEIGAYELQPAIK